jgi:GDP-4-dehydro-6-deoxy-D-mannose reductase
MTQRYLLTGAQGFIGRHMVSHLLWHSPQSSVLGVGRSPRQDSFFNYSVSCGDRRVPATLPEYLRTAVGPRYRYLSMDITSVDFSAAVCDFRPTKVIHLAAALRGAPDELIHQNNVRSTASLLQAIGQCDVEMLLFASSGGVYGKQDYFPIDETAVVLPLDSYSRSKFASEDLVRQFAFQSGVPTAIARIFNVLGPGQDELHFAGRLASQLTSILTGKAEPIVRVGPLSSSRDFLDVRDICFGLSVILESLHQGVYNVGSGVETEMRELLRVFLGAAGLRKDVQIETDAARIDPVPRHVANIGRLAGKGFSPQYSLELSCQEMLAYCARYVHGTPGEK